jgi:ABC-type transport system substrate-binding protein
VVVVNIVAVLLASMNYMSSNATCMLQTTLMVGKTFFKTDPSSAEMYTGQQLASTYIQMAKQAGAKATVTNLSWDINWQQLAEKITASTVPQTQLIESMPLIVIRNHTSTADTSLSTHSA